LLLDRRLMWGNESLPFPCEVNTISLISGGTGNALLSHSKKAEKNTGGVVGEAYSSQPIWVRCNYSQGCQLDRRKRGIVTPCELRYANFCDKKSPPHPHRGTRGELG